MKWLTWLTWLIAWYLPLCATTGAAGVTPPGVVDFTHIHFKGHSEAFMAPADFTPPPMFIAPVFNMPPSQLFTRLQDIAALQPRTYTLDTEPNALQAAWVIRSALWNFPDIVDVEVVPEPNQKSSFIFYSHAIYGWSDYGVNRKHALRWLKDLNMKVSN